MAVTTGPSTVPRGPVTATINFSLPPPGGATAFRYVDEPPAGEPQTNVREDPHPVLIQDIRGREAEFTLDKDAFQIVRGVAPSAESSASNFRDDASVAANYYPEVERLLLSQIPGSARVLIFDHTLRRADGQGVRRRPALLAHVDQTPRSAEKRVRRHLGEAEAETLLRGRYRIVNVWRTLNEGPLEMAPLAYASSSSLRDEDVITAEHRYKDGYVGETASIAYNPGQKWYYLSGMTSDERLLIECFDSEAANKDSGVIGGRLPHSAFEDPRTRPDAEVRESIEVRALVFGP